MDELSEFQAKAIFLDVDVRKKGNLDVMDENILWNAHDQKTLLWHSDWKLNCQICLFDVYCASKLNCYIFDASVSNRHIIEQGVSECLSFSVVVEYSIQFTSFY